MPLDLVDRIERRRFVGREFLVWLWFETHVLEGELEATGVGSFEVQLETQLTLALDKEQSRLKGSAPSSGREAREALRQGKLPTHARLRVARAEHDYTFQLVADGLALSSVKIPAHVKDEKHEQFYERMFLVEELERVLDALYSDFLALRLSKAWGAEILPMLQAWVREEDVDGEAYGRVREATLAKKRAREARAPEAEAV